jgi:hypothetical protein
LLLAHCVDLASAAFFIFLFPNRQLCSFPQYMPAYRLCWLATMPEITGTHQDLVVDFYIYIYIAGLEWSLMMNTSDLKAVLFWVVKKEN